MDKKKFTLIIHMAFIITGTSIGAGILGLPIQTGISGLVPSYISLILIWVFLNSSAWILFYKTTNSKDEPTNFVTLYTKELGNWSKWVNTIGFFITFYGLITAYLSGIATTVINIFSVLKGIPAITIYLIIIFFIITISFFVLGIKYIKKLNLILSVFLVFAFLIIVFYTFGAIKPENLLHQNWQLISFDLPILVTAFAFHGVVPVISNHVTKENKYGNKELFIIMILGSLLALVFYCIWTLIVLGIVPLTSESSISIKFALENNLPATIPVAKIVQSTSITIIAFIFTFFAIFTSYLGVGIGFLNYVEGLIRQYTFSRILELLITFLIPLIAALVFPSLFINTLNFVGGIGLIIIFGFLPGILGLQKKSPAYIKCLGVIVLLFSIYIFIYELYSIISNIYFYLV